MTAQTATIEIRSRLCQAQSMLKSLRYSYHITTSKSHQQQAIRLAPTIREIRPMVYQVGTCTVDFWRKACTCKQMRSRKLRGIQPTAQPCPHFTALFLAGIWTPCDMDPTAYLRKAGVTRPEILAVYCRASLPGCYPPAPEGFRIISISPDYAVLENIATGTHVDVPPATLRQVTPFYE